MNYMQKLYEALKLVYQSKVVYTPIISDERFEDALIPFSIPDFSLSSSKLNNFVFRCCIEPFYIDIIIKQNKTIPSPFTVKNQKYFFLILQ